MEWIDVRAKPPELIEDIEFRVEDAELYLVVTGDFTRTFSAYLDNKAAGGVVLSIGGHMADELCKSLYEIKHG